ncbi:hypothetical protein EDC65_4082 [Stella humosa]|uniref:Metal-dependent enzyme (Double-stranded beta helix superfamily) n=1 Tax=Stella humosa TaxID=94 RepID=A0A3N1L1P8_9PROT|nr:hypothetical protein [Stella humosa]ROP83435.1 hypothetical protein EDC65_4082 [Stella humosa]BBK33293.1 hypothetical protein STHU_39270 [Stella humosa]
MFDRERFVEECQAAVAADPTHKAAREVMLRAMADPAQVLRGLGAPTRAMVDVLYRSPELTILNLVWGAKMTIQPHNHRMWAVIGIYSGREDNIFWRRVEGSDGRMLEAAGAEALSTGDVAPLGRDVIHSVTNPIPRFTGALHVYGGDFFAPGRSQWDPGRLTEEPYDSVALKQAFEDANAALVRA